MRHYQRSRSDEGAPLAPAQKPFSVSHLGKTHRQHVCPIVLPNFQQCHHHLVKLISRQNPVVVHVKHLKADWRKPEEKGHQTICNAKNSPVFWVRSVVVQGLHFCLSAMGPLQHAESPHEISLKSMWLSRFSSKAWNNPARQTQPFNKAFPFPMLRHSHTLLPSLSEAWMGGETRGTNVSKSKRPVLDWAFSSQYRFSKSIISDSSTVQKKKKTKTDQFTRQRGEWSKKK